MSCEMLNFWEWYTSFVLAIEKYGVIKYFLTW